MKIFNLTMYENLSQENKDIVHDWIFKYDVHDAMLIEASEGNPDDPIETNIRLTVMGPRPYYYYHEDKSVTNVVDMEEEEYRLVKLAEFEFDDFPWEVLD